MNYDEQVNDLLVASGRYCVQSPTCASKMIDAAHSIRHLLTRAEAAEKDRDRLLEAMKPNCLMCDSMHENGNCTEVGGFCTAVPAAHCPLIPRLLNQLSTEKARADKTEKERDAAIKELDGVSNAVGDLSDFVDDQIYPLIQYDMYAALRDNIYAITTWEKESEWRGQKEE